MKQQEIDAIRAQMQREHDAEIRAINEDALARYERMLAKAGRNIAEEKERAKKSWLDIKEQFQELSKEPAKENESRIETTLREANERMNIHFLEGAKNQHQMVHEGILENLETNRASIVKELKN